MRLADPSMLVSSTSVLQWANKHLLLQLSIIDGDSMLTDSIVPSRIPGGKILITH